MSRPLELLGLQAAIATMCGDPLMVTEAELATIRRAEADQAVRSCGETHSDWEMAVRRAGILPAAFEVRVRVVKQPGDPGWIEPKGHG